ncbi:MAG: nicotinate phosphoribosyltransferase [Chloroflexi bacterium]|nr:nicotinate phosphoribosyltransferase [Chloroflexota bacterium]MBI4315831.1 nicotinate phosphoribosyltransferase [Chloroflexota bacterium]
MTVFDRTRLTDDTFKLDLERMRRGWYSDKYFENIGAMLATLAGQGYRYSGRSPRLADVPAAQLAVLATGDLEVEMQWFTRRPGKTIVVGVDKALAMLRGCTGYIDSQGRFVGTWGRLIVEAVHDGATVWYNGDPLAVQPVIRARGRYRDFALLETPTLGILTRASRVATNVYNTLVAARGKPVLFFPARFDLHEVQAADGYAYNIAVQRFNHDYQETVSRFVSTDAQGDWWGGAGGGTVAHAAIACFLGDTAEAMLAFSATRPAHIPRIALVDFNNDSVSDSLATLDTMFARFRELTDAGDTAEAEKYRLYGVRLDTSGSVRDVNVPPLGDPALDLGVNPRLVFIVRQALDNAWQRWSLPAAWADRAHGYCHAVKIVVSGGFSPEKITRFEKLAVPVDIYAVGSSLFDNHGPTVSDFTADVVRVKIDGEWRDLAKVGRRACDNPDLEPVP